MIIIYFLGDFLDVFIDVFLDVFLDDFLDVFLGLIVDFFFPPNYVLLLSVLFLTLF